jgi:hypothetical protein
VAAAQIGLFRVAWFKNAVAILKASPVAPTEGPARKISNVPGKARLSLAHAMRSSAD